MKLKGRIERISFTGNEAVITVLTVDKWQVNTLSELVSKMAKNDNTNLEIDFKPYKSKRSLEQNRLMWEMLSLLSENVHGKKDSELVWETYCEMLLRFGQRAEYLQGLPSAMEMLKRQFRAVRLVEKRQVNGKELHIYQCFEGSSKFNTKEMTEFIGSIQSELAELGVHYEIDNTGQ